MELCSCNFKISKDPSFLNWWLSVGLKPSLKFIWIVISSVMMSNWMMCTVMMCSFLLYQEPAFNTFSLGDTERKSLNTHRVLYDWWLHMVYSRVKFSFLLTAFPYKPSPKKEAFWISFELTLQPIFLDCKRPKSAATAIKPRKNSIGKHHSANCSFAPVEHL